VQVVRAVCQSGECIVGVAVQEAWVAGLRYSLDRLVASSGDCGVSLELQQAARRAVERQLAQGATAWRSWPDLHAALVDSAVVPNSAAALKLCESLWSRFLREGLMKLDESGCAAPVDTPSTGQGWYIPRRKSKSEERREREERKQELLRAKAEKRQAAQNSAGAKKPRAKKA